MSLLKIGERDRHGRQKRIEHTGRHLRASRTGGVSLRAQTRMAGVNLSANTNHGLRVSTRLAKNTQVAFQNGRFVLRGRYGSDAARFNLSRSGVTVSSRTPIGSFNWMRPNRSSVKLGGVQLRGRNAAHLQMAFALVHIPFAAMTLLLGLLGRLAGAGVAVAGALAMRRQRVREDALRPDFAIDVVLPPAERLLRHHAVDPDALPNRDLLALLTALLLMEGRGRTELPAIPADADHPGIADAFGEDLARAAGRLRGWLAPMPEGEAAPGALAAGLLAAIARAYAARVDAGTRAETLLSLDDAALAAGPRTLLQEAMIDLLAEALEVELVLEGEA